MISLSRYGFFVVFCVACGGALLFTGCEEALTDSNQENVPEIDGLGNDRWIEIAGRDTISEDRGATQTYTISPAYAPSDTAKVTLNVWFSVAGTGSAQQGRDYNVLTSSPASFDVDPQTANLNTVDIEVKFPHSDQVNEPKTVTIQLDSARAASGKSFPVGRGGTKVGKSKFVEVDWSKANIFVQNSAGYQFDDTQVDSTSSSGGDLLAVNLASFRASDLSNFAIEGENSDEFQIAGFLTQPPSPPAPATLPITLQPSQGNVGLFVIAFAPQSTGEKSAELTFEASNVPSPLQMKTIPLSGTATAP